MGTKPTATTQHGHAAIGGAATLREAGIPPLPPPVADPTRKVSPDATGYYEADPRAPMWNSNRTLHLNQAGRALVGWFTPPPGFVKSTQEFPVRFAVLVADLDPTLKTAKGYQFWYKTFDSLVGMDPDEVLSPFKPWDRNQEDLAVGVFTGWINFQPASDSWDYFGQKLVATLSFFLPDGTDTTPIDMFHKAPYPRAAERTIAFQAPTLKRALIVRHRRPVPASFFDTSKQSGFVWRDARALFDPDPRGKLAVQIAEYEAHKGVGPDNTPQRIKALDAMGDLLGKLPWQGSDHAKLLNMLLGRDAERNSLKAAGQDKTYREWLSSIAANEVTNGRSYPPIFNQFLGGATIRRYDFEFSALSKDIELFPFVKGGGGGFKVTITAFSAALDDSGRMPDDSAFKLLDKHPAELFGAFLEIKVGLESPPELPEKISFYTSEEILSTDFNGAYFALIALDASASASAGLSNPVMDPRVKLSSGGDTQLLRVYVKDTILEQSCASGSLMPHWSASKGFHAPDWDQLKRIASKRGIAEDSDFFSMKAGVKVSAGVSLGLGYLGHQHTFAHWMQAARATGSAWAQGGDARTISAGFERDSADFTNREENGWKLRFLLETVLATDLALFGGVAEVDVEGFASPEASPTHNLILSQKRANAVLQVIDDAVGPLDPDNSIAHGRGDYDSLHEGHLNDPDSDDPEERAKFEADHDHQVSQWPQWRKVEVNVRGHFSVHVVTAGNETG